LKTGDVQWRLTNSATVAALAWHPGNLRLAAATADGGVVLWDPLNGRKMGQTTLPASVRSLVFNPAGTLAESGLDWELPLTPAAAAPATTTDRARAPR